MKELRIIRTARGLSQNALSALVGIAATKLSDYERGVHMPSLASIVRLANGLDCSIDELVGRTALQLRNVPLNDLLAEVDRRSI